jgi:hypothetical protein
LPFKSRTSRSSKLRPDHHVKVTQARAGDAAQAEKAAIDETVKAYTNANHDLATGKRAVPGALRRNFWVLHCAFQPVRNTLS